MSDRTSDRTRVIVIFAVIVAVLGGGLYYFLRVYSPRQERAGAQKEIVAWEARLAEVRACLLGEHPASAKAREALAVRELSPDPWNRGTCSKLIGKLSRGVAEDTGMMKVEHAWMTIDRAAAKVATAFASHVDPGGDVPEHRVEDPLPQALEELDAAQAELHAAAGMDPPPALAGASLPTAEVIPLMAGNLPVTELADWRLPSNGGIVGFGIAHEREVELVLTAGAAPKVMLTPSGGDRALPAGTWGAADLQREIVVGPIDDNGAFSAMTNLPAGDIANVVLTAGAINDGLVAFAAGDTLGLVQLGATPPKTVATLPVTRIAVAEAPSGRSLLAWTTPDGAMHGLLPTAGTAPVPMELGSGEAAQACITATQAWIGAAPQYMAFDGKSATPHVLPGHTLLGCSTTAALLHKVDSTTYAVCTEGCRVVELANTRSSFVATLAGDKVVAARTQDTVIGLWRENAAPLFFVTPVPFTPRAAISDGKVVDLVGQTHDGLALARLSLR